MNPLLEAKRIRVMVVDDSPSVRAALKSILAGDSGIEVIASVADPFEAAERMRTEVPDVLLLDLELPKMNGLTFLSKIMAQRPIPVVVCSSHSETGSPVARRALEIGAAGVITKPALATPAQRREAQVLIGDAVRAAAQALSRARKPAPQAIDPEPKLTADAVLPPARPGAARPPRTQPIVAIGASTGGTEALGEVLAELPHDAPPIVIVQHMPEKFTAAFAQRLDGICRVRVAEAASGDVLSIGQALIAPGDQHLVVRRQGATYRIEILRGPHVARHRPSVDVLFRSVAQCAGPNALGLILTGMGDDGARGLLEMREAGSRTVAQDEATSVVFGMPREALRMGATTRALPLSQMSAEIMAWGRGAVAHGR